LSELFQQALVLKYDHLIKFSLPFQYLTLLQFSASQETKTTSILCMTSLIGYFSLNRESRALESSDG